MSDIVQVLLDLYHKRATGLLKVSCDNFIKQIYFKGGSPVYVDSNIREENLGEILMREGKLTREQNNQVITYMLENDRRQGEAIVELGLMSGLEVFQALENQIREKLVNCLLAEKVESVWRAGTEEVDQIMEFSIDLIAVLYKGIREKYTLERIKREFGVKLDEALHPVPEQRELLQRLKLSGDEQKILRLANGRNSLGQIIKTPGIDAKAAFSELFALYYLGLLKSGPPLAVEAEPHREPLPAPPPPRPAPKAAPPKESAAIPSENEIYLLHLKISYLDHFRCLGLSPEAGPTDIKNAYHELIRRHRLDEIGKHYQGKNAEQAQAVFDRFTLAYAVLSNPQHRAQYMAELGKNTKKTEPSAKLLAEVELRKAMLFLDKKQEEEALQHLGKAIELDADNAFLFSHRALTNLRRLDRAMRSEADKKTAAEKNAELKGQIEQDLHEALKKNPRCLEALALSGTYQRLYGDPEKAKAMLQRALEIKPNDPKITVELRLLESQKGKGKGEGTIFGLKLK